MFVLFITGAISIGMVFLFGCVGEIITEKAGHLNLGIPGIMCVGTAGGCFFVSLYMKGLASPTTDANWFVLILVAILGAVLFGFILGGIYAFLTVSLKSNQNITGLALTTFGSGFTQFFMDNFVDRSNLSAAARIVSKSLPFADKLGWFGDIFLSYGVLVYLAIIIAVVTAIFLKKTRTGLRLRAVGENPSAADAVGIDIVKYKYIAILTGSSIAALGGMFYILDYIKGSWENASTIEAMGWLSVALVIFTLWKPNLSIVGSILFGGLYIAPYVISGITISLDLIKMLPYVVTVIVLIITSVLDSKENQPPASLGLSYFREER